MAAKRAQGAHEQAVRRDLARLLAEDREGGVAQLALTLARRLDEEWLTSRDLAAVSARFETVMATLGRLQEPAAVVDPVDELAAKRRRRVGNAG